MTVVYGIASCDSVRKARAWLQGAGVAYEFHDFKRGGLPEELLDRWICAVGWELLLNRKGTTWRRLDDAARAWATDLSGARTLMLAQPTLVKRPVVEWVDGAVSVGFDAARFAAGARAG
jgi:Spx/MgsR family transcriptional regulator